MIVQCMRCRKRRRAESFDLREDGTRVRVCRYCIPRECPGCHERLAPSEFRNGSARCRTCDSRVAEEKKLQRTYDIERTVMLVRHHAYVEARIEAGKVEVVDLRP